MSKLRYITTMEVLSVDEVVEERNWRKEEGGPVCDRVPLGVWSVRLSESSALLLPEKPDFTTGDRVRLILERE